MTTVTFFKANVCIADNGLRTSCWMSEGFNIILDGYSLKMVNHWSNVM